MDVVTASASTSAPSTPTLDVKPPLPLVGATAAAAAAAAAAATCSDSASAETSADATATAGCGAGAPTAPSTTATGPLSLSDLIDAISAVLSSGDPSVDKERAFCDLLRAYDPSSGDYKRYRMFDAGKNYTRNLVVDDEQFTLMVLCWNPERYSPVHDHPCDGCWMRCLEGSVREVRYNADLKDGAPLEVVADTVASVGDVLYIDDAQALHKVGNPTAEAAVTLHLYSPPFSQCRVWLNEDRSDEVLKPVIAYYSEHGTKVELDDD